MYAYDLQLFTWIHDFAGRSAVGDALIVFVGSYVLYILLAICAYRLFVSYRKNCSVEVESIAIALFSGIIARIGVTELIRLFVHRTRPFLEFGIPHLLTDTEYSFPSGHAIFISAVAAVIFAKNRTLGIFVFFVAVLVGCARVAAGVHYPSDVLAGLILGAITGSVVMYMWNRINRKHRN